MRLDAAQLLGGERILQPLAAFANFSAGSVRICQVLDIRFLYHVHGP